MDQPDETGFPPHEIEHRDAVQPASQRSTPAAWMTPKLLRDTQSVWSRFSGREVSEDEAVEILTNVKRLADVLRQATEEM